MQREETRGAIHNALTAVVACSMALACGASEPGEGAETLHSGTGGTTSAEGGSAVSGSNSGGGTTPLPTSDASTDGAGIIACGDPLAIDSGNWQACSSTDGGPAAPVPEGTLLAQSDTYFQWADWVGDYLYLAGFSCGCSGPCPVTLEGCTWSVEHLDPCSQTHVPVGSGRTYEASVLSAKSVS